MKDVATLVDLAGRVVRPYEQIMTMLGKVVMPVFDNREIAQLTRLLADLKGAPQRALAHNNLAYIDYRSFTKEKKE